MEKNMNMQQRSYRKFGLMLAVSYIVMQAVMYLNVDQFSHVYIGLTRLYMTILMVAPMALIMLAFMGSMYKNRRTNGLIIGASIVTFIGVFILLRTQTFVNDEQYMKAMIPHHSSAIMVSRAAALKDPELRKLATGIIESQEREIAEMKAILARMNK
ncbi:DUF305 domain-containing protein [Spirosoma flavum]|uniref:DUF305 domain-containing protein n=1 Tax=Spirosoma flavum TaxID=2048557 RepID=A0ABW6ANS6_9BACT